MYVVYHLGAPCTDGDGLIKSLLKNRADLARRGIVVPPPGLYRPMLRDAARALGGHAATPEQQDALLEALAGDGPVQRLVVSDPRFVCINRLVVQGAQIWPMIGRQTEQLRGLFPDDVAAFFIGMRDPATLIPALFRASRFNDFEEFTENMQPHAVVWSEMLHRLRATHPGAPIPVWCNEDTPLLWGSILAALAGIDDPAMLAGRDDLAESLMLPEGGARLRAYLAENPTLSESQRRRAVAAFLDRYVREEVVEEEFDLPGWTADLVAEISEAYERDLARIAQMEGVRLLLP
jgi:hypothetical protein